MVNGVKLSLTSDKRKRILVTGGAGFLGSHLVDRLLVGGHEVLCLDNLFTGSKGNISHNFDNPRFEFLHHDICEPLQVEVDEIYNLACPASPIHYQYDPVKTSKTCVFGAIHMLDLAHRLQCKILQASTSEVYGDPEIHPQPETYHGNVNPIGIRACYDEGKRCAETLFFDYHRQFGVKIKVARIFNTYGPRMHPEDGRVVSNFIIAALKGKDIHLYGDGSQTRSFCYVDDLITGLVALMDTSTEITGPINLGNPSEIQIADLGSAIIRKTGGTSKYQYLPALQDDPQRRQPDINQARLMLGWSPRTTLGDGLEAIISYFRELLGSPNNGNFTGTMP